MTTSVRLIAVHIVVALAIAAIALIAVDLAGWSPRIGYVLTLSALAAVASVGVRRAASATTEARWPAKTSRRADEPATDPRIGTIETMLRRSATDPPVFARRLQPLLHDLASHGLLRHHGVDLATEPDEARRLLGTDAWTLVHEPVDRPIGPTRLARVIAAIEGLDPTP